MQMVTIPEMAATITPMKTAEQVTAEIQAIYL